MTAESEDQEKDPAEQNTQNSTGRISRRAVLLGGASLTGLAGAGVWAAARTLQSPPAPAAVATSPVANVDQWRRSAHGAVHIAHRGVAAVIPEHSLEGYTRAVEDGGTCMEISTVLTSDRILVCQHDLTLERTTNATGKVSARTNAQLAQVKAVQPGLGPRWQGNGAVGIATLEKVLDVVSDKAILCLEAKDDAGFPLLLETIRRRQLQDRIFIKVPVTSHRIEEASKAGLPVFAYYGTVEGLTPESVQQAAAKLSRHRDVLVLPARTIEGARTPEAPLAAAVRTGIPVWVHPVHRRSDIDYFRARMVQGFISSHVGYTSGTVPVRKTVAWGEGMLGPGDLVLDPYAEADRLEWPDPGTVRLRSRQKAASLLLGSLCPIASTEGSYRVEFDVRFDKAASNTSTSPGFVLAFCHLDDRYYDHEGGVGDGYHATLSPSGQLAIGAHHHGKKESDQLTADVAGSDQRWGRWARMRLEVSPGSIRWGFADGAGVQTTDTRWRGGYLHVGRTAGAPAVSIRSVAVS
ncbi:glycerophosphodiester phosphodiesterase [Austwickia chelonae]|uniref:glycerophosphodiester phosphodiesterase n=1 Tax=Austwickia chelonae TaxID=100225 RepID=UPI000E24C688|nr:glycerophosphodiester phosphodiesterase family protein [Austwickia chelonae]